MDTITRRDDARMSIERIQLAACERRRRLARRRQRLIRRKAIREFREAGGRLDSDNN